MIIFPAAISFAGLTMGRSSAFLKAAASATFLARTRLNHLENSPAISPPRSLTISACIAALTSTATWAEFMERFAAQAMTIKKIWGRCRKMLKSLVPRVYTTQVGGEQPFILEHSVGSIPYNNEIDVPLNYVDYYYIKALLRFKGTRKD